MRCARSFFLHLFLSFNCLDLNVRDKLGYASIEGFLHFLKPYCFFTILDKLDPADRERAGTLERVCCITSRCSTQSISLTCNIRRRTMPSHCTSPSSSARRVSAGANFRYPKQQFFNSSRTASSVPKEQFCTFLVHDGALLVQHVIIGKDLLAGIKWNPSIFFCADSRDRVICTLLQSVHLQEYQSASLYFSPYRTKTRISVSSIETKNCITTWVSLTA